MSDDIAPIPATVQRMVYPEEPKLQIPSVEHRTRDIYALMAQAEWGWSKKETDAYVFADLSVALRHVGGLKLEGEKHAHAFIHSKSKAREVNFRRRGDQAAADAERSAGELGITSEEAFRNLERRGLA